MHHTWLFLTASSFVTFIILLIMVRWIGSTQLTQLTFFNWVAGASMGNIAANMIVSTSIYEWSVSFYALVLFTGVTVLAAFLGLKIRSLRGVVNGEPLVLIHKGIIYRQNLRKSRVSIDVLMMMLREKGFFAYSDIEYAILEPTGNLSVLPVSEAQSASKADLVKEPDLSPKGQGPYIEIVIDGEVDRDKLAETNHDEAWLHKQLEKLGGAAIEDVLFLGVNAQDEIIVDLHRRRLPRRPEI